MNIEKLENLPQKQSFRVKCNDIDYFRHRWNYPWKRVNRFLISKIGKPWTEVVSEFTHSLWIPKQYRTYKRLTQEVIVNTFIENGEVRYYDKWHGSDYSINLAKGVFYVNPENGLLCCVPNKKREYKAPESNKLFWTENHFLEKIDGIWFEIKYKRITIPSYRDSLGKFHGEYTYTKKVLKHQLNRKELRKFGLKNN